MAEFKCIRCGAVKESDSQGSCPVCGYKTFETPFDRSEILRKEIIRFIAGLRPVTVSSDLFEIVRNAPKKQNGAEDGEGSGMISKQDDDKRFPDFSKIQDYVCSSEKTEIFHERLNVSLEEIKKHIHTPYGQKYQVSMPALTEEVKKYDGILKDALPVLGINTEPEQFVPPKFDLDYSETPNESLLGLADAILDDLAALSDKIKKFIKQNNIYGSSYREKPKLSYDPSADENYAEDLRSCGARLTKILDKKYEVDIFSDGSDELNEMLKALWKAAQVVMTVPVLEKRYVYTLPNGTTAVNNDVGKELLKIFNSRYSEIDETVYAFDFLTDKTEDELFELYDRMIDLDAQGLMGVNKAGLLKIGESEKKLNELIGLSGIKESIKKIKAYALANKDSKDLNIHMCFLGNPGSGKTEVARYIAGILYENKILPTKKIIEVDRSGLVSQYFGATAEKTSRVIDDAMGGVLFIDEAYALGNNSDHGITDYGKEAIDTLVKAMEDNRGKFCVILAGYKNEMLQMLSTNPGFKSRIQFTLDFPNYSRSELKSITELMLKSRGYTVGDAAMSRILDVTDVKRKEPNFANAREIRNILDQVIMCQNVRCAGSDDKELGLVDVNKYIRDAKINLPTAGETATDRILTGEEELDRLIGLSAVKRMIKKINAYAKRNKGEADFNLHMCFLGNPGTGKTEVARILSRLLYDAGVLDEAKLVETDGQGLIGKYVGETAPKTKSKINDAMNGVLFIDEAYSLSGSGQSGGSADYGEEAIAVLLKEMEDNRGRFCVILAGYKDKMREMLNSNPGFESRIQFTLEFPDYTREELGEIAKAFLRKKRYDVEVSALEKILDVTEYFRKRPNFANARTVRNVIDQVIMNQNLRTEDTSDDRMIIKDDVESYLTDEGIDLSSTSSGTGRIGFV